MSAPVRVAVLGAAGRMGLEVRRILAEAPDLVQVAAVDRRGNPEQGTVALEADCFADAQVVIDFSLPEALEAALPLLGARALVTGTTGLSPELQRRLDAQAERGPVLQAANFSTGVTLLAHLAQLAAGALPDYDVEIVESHHRFKQDAPSGTALLLGRAVAEARRQALERVARHGREGRTGVRDPSEIGFHALRLGDVVGDHQVWLGGPGERVMLGHVATSRATFAQGAVRAARWVADKPPGQYTMQQMLGLEQ